jgi:hypothetical protein
MVCDPVSGDVLALQADSLFAYSFATQQWHGVIKNPLLPYDSHKFMVVPISTYGVVAYLTVYQWPVLLYKHADNPAAIETRNASATRLVPDMVAAPNPFKPISSITYSLPASGHVELSVYDLAGKLIKTLASGQRSAGQHNVHWDATNLNGAKVSAGVYVYRLKAGSRVLVSRVVLAE